MASYRAFQDEWGPIIRKQAHDQKLLHQQQLVERQQQKDQLRQSLQYQIERKQRQSSAERTAERQTDRSDIMERQRLMNEYEMKVRAEARERKQKLATAYLQQQLSLNTIKTNTRQHEVQRDRSHVLNVQNQLMSEAQLRKQLNQQKASQERAVIDFTTKRRELERQHQEQQKAVDKQNLKEYTDKQFLNYNVMQQKLYEKMQAQDYNTRNHSAFVNRAESSKIAEEHARLTQQKLEVDDRLRKKEMIEQELRFANSRAYSDQLRAQMYEKEIRMQSERDHKSRENAETRQRWVESHAAEEKIRQQRRNDFLKYGNILSQQIGTKQDPRIADRQLTDHERLLNAGYLDRNISLTPAPQLRVPSRRNRNRSMAETFERRMAGSTEPRVNRSMEIHNPIINPVGSRIPVPEERPLYKARYNFKAEPLVGHLRDNDGEGIYYTHNF